MKRQEAAQVFAAIVILGLIVAWFVLLGLSFADALRHH